MNGLALEFSQAKSQNVRTHYENLKISENAPDEVIRAAYRALCQTWHPDKNPGNADAVLVMQIINSAYELLSNPERRRRYDQHLAEMRRQRCIQPPPPYTPQPTSPSDPKLSSADKPWTVKRILNFVHALFVIFVIVLVSIYIISDSFQFGSKSVQPYSPVPPGKGSESYKAALQEAGANWRDVVNQGLASPRQKAVPSAPVHFNPYIRPTTDPNGQPWPTVAAYISGYLLLADDGFSRVTVDNSKNTSDVFLKLVVHDASPAYPVRVCFIPGGSSFTFRNVGGGEYDVRYCTLNTGSLSQTEAFTLKETKTSTGTVFSNITLTLYTVANGNMHTHSIDESEF